MDIKRTRIQHKRYTYDEWINGILIEEGKPKLIPELSQGEIGVLLNADKSQVIEVRIGTSNNQKFGDGLLLGHQEQPDMCVKQYPNNLAFPTLGKENQIYISQATNSIWRWDDTDMKYYECSSKADGSSWQEIEAIDGGDSNNLPSLNI